MAPKRLTLPTGPAGITECSVPDCRWTLDRQSDRGPRLQGWLPVSLVRGSGIERHGLAFSSPIPPLAGTEEKKTQPDPTDTTTRFELHAEGPRGGITARPRYQDRQHRARRHACHVQQQCPTKCPSSSNPSSACAGSRLRRIKSAPASSRSIWLPSERGRPGEKVSCPP